MNQDFRDAIIAAFEPEVILKIECLSADKKKPSRALIRQVGDMLDKQGYRYMTNTGSTVFFIRRDIHAI